jgi:diguanylate cyclase (GGDEF)-like protein
LPFFCVSAYIIGFCFLLLLKFRESKYECSVLLFVGIFCVIVSILEAFSVVDQILNTSMLIGVFFYEMYLYFSNARRDYLTGLLNRHSFYNDLRNTKKKVVALISMDLNGFKQINDTFGHFEGDKALKEVSYNLLRVKGFNLSIYRIGGDEFNALLYSGNEDDCKKVIVKMNQNVIEAGYSCSFGYCLNSEDLSIDDLCKIADKNMYIEKEKYYQELKKM